MLITEVPTMLQNTNTYLCFNFYCSRYLSLIIFFNILLYNILRSLINNG